MEPANNNTPAVAGQPTAVAERPTFTLPSGPVSFSMGGGIFASAEAFNSAQRFAAALAASTMVPTAYAKNLANCLIACEYAANAGASPLMVMQNLDIINGKPGWNAKFITSLLMNCGRFDEIELEYGEDGMVQPRVGQPVKNLTCRVVTTRRSNGKVLNGPLISIKMAIAEDWYGKAGSKWPNMPDLMLGYRAAAFFGRLYAPDVLLGMLTGDELREGRGQSEDYQTTGAELMPDATPPTTATGEASVLNIQPPATAGPAPTRKRRTAAQIAADNQAAAEPVAEAIVDPVAEATQLSHEAATANVGVAEAPASAPIMEKLNAITGPPATVVMAATHQTGPTETAAERNQRERNATAAQQYDNQPAEPALGEPVHYNPDSWPLGFEFITVNGDVETPENKEPENIGERAARFRIQLRAFYERQQNAINDNEGIGEPTDAAELTNEADNNDGSVDFF